MKSDRIVIVGAGQAGARAAEALRANGHVGAVTVLGAEAHLPYERPQLSKDILLGEGEVPIRFIRDAAAWAALGIDLVTGAAVAECDPQRRVVRLADGRVHSYDRLVLATGTVARRLPGCETGTAPVRYLRTIADARAIRQGLVRDARVVIVGGGVIGLEVAAAAVVAGCRVTIVEAAPTLLSRAFPTAASAFLLRRHRAAGVEFVLGAEPASADADAVVLGDGHRLAADMIVVGIGAQPSSELACAMGLDAVHGIRVDAFGQTDQEGVFAVGDVTQQWHPHVRRWARVETWANAQNQAIAAAKSLAGVPTAYADPPWFWTDQYADNLQIVGDMAAGDVVARGDVASDAFALIAIDDGIVRGALTVNRRADMAVFRRLAAGGVRLVTGNVEDPSFDLRKTLLAA